MAIISEDDPRLVFVRLGDAVVPPPGIIEHLKDRWWVFHPDRGLVYWSDGRRHNFIYPQANPNRRVIERFVEVMYPWARAELIPSVFRRISISDYT